VNNRRTVHIILQGSVETYCKCGGKYDMDLVPGKYCWVNILSKLWTNSKWHVFLWTTMYNVQRHSVRCITCRQLRFFLAYRTSCRVSVTTTHQRIRGFLTTMRYISRQYLSTLCPKKVYPLMCDNNFGKCGPIFKILSPADSWENSLCEHAKTSTSPAFCCYSTSWK